MQETPRSATFDWMADGTDGTCHGNMMASPPCPMTQPSQLPQDATAVIADGPAELPPAGRPTSRAHTLLAGLQLVSVTIGARVMCSGMILLFSLVMARQATPVDFRTYVTISATVSYLVFFLGFELYTASFRAVASEVAPTGIVLPNSQFAIHALTYAVAVPILILLGALGLFPPAIVFPIALIVPAEHFAQEVFRLLLALRRPVAANICMVIRQFMPFGVATVVSLVVDGHTALLVLYVGWALGALSATVIGMVLTRQNVHWQIPGIDDIVAFLAENFRSIRWFWLQAAALRLLIVIDIYFVTGLGTAVEGAAYGLFATILTIVPVVVESGAVMIAVPDLMRAAGSSNRGQDEFDKERRRFRYHVGSATIVVSLVLVITGIVLGPHVQPVYFNNFQSAYFMLILAGVISSAALIPHYELYALHIDRPNSLASLGGVIVAVGVLLAVSGFISPFWAASARCAGYATVLISKSILIRRI